MKCTLGNQKGISIGIPHTINAISCTQTCLALEVRTEGNYEDTSTGIPHTQLTQSLVLGKAWHRKCTHRKTMKTDKTENHEDTSITILLHTTRNPVYAPLFFSLHLPVWALALSPRVGPVVTNKNCESCWLSFKWLCLHPAPPCCLPWH